jgi:DNA-directed RNA polymerase subunit M/transcription elongation factor TFIIS
MKQKPTCPNCVEILKPKTKPFGRGGAKRIFLQCPICGYNFQKNSIPYDEKKEIMEFEKRVNETNNKWL